MRYPRGETTSKMAGHYCETVQKPAGGKVLSSHQAPAFGSQYPGMPQNYLPSPPQPFVGILSSQSTLPAEQLMASLVPFFQQFQQQQAIVAQNLQQLTGISRFSDPQSPVTRKERPGMENQTAALRNASVEAHNLQFRQLQEQYAQMGLLLKHQEQLLLLHQQMLKHVSEYCQLYLYSATVNHSSDAIINLSQPDQFSALRPTNQPKISRSIFTTSHSAPALHKPEACRACPFVCIDDPIVWRSGSYRAEYSPKPCTFLSHLLDRNGVRMDADMARAVQFMDLFKRSMEQKKQEGRITMYAVYFKLNCNINASPPNRIN